MANEINRVMKMQKCLSVKFHAKDADGDTVFVDIEGEQAQNILDYLKRGIQDGKVSVPTTLLRSV